MSVDYQTLFNISITLLGFVLGLMVTRVFRKLDELTLQDKELTHEMIALKVALPTNYVTKEHLEGIALAVFSKLDHIVDKLDGKVDKI